MLYEQYTIQVPPNNLGNICLGGVNDDVISSNDGEDINDEPIDDIISATELKGYIETSSWIDR